MQSYIIPPNKKTVITILNVMLKELNKQTSDKKLIRTLTTNALNALKNPNFGKRDWD